MLCLFLTDFLINHVFNAFCFGLAEVRCLSRYGRFTNAFLVSCRGRESLLVVLRTLSAALGTIKVNMLMISIQNC